MDSEFDSEDIHPDDTTIQSVGWIDLSACLSLGLAVGLLVLFTSEKTSYRGGQEVIERNDGKTIEVVSVPKSDAPSVSYPLSRWLEFALPVVALGSIAYGLFVSIRREWRRDRAVRFKIGDREILVRPDTTDAEIERQVREAIRH